MKKDLIYRCLLVASLGIFSQISISNAADTPSGANKFKGQGGNPPPPVGPNQIQIAPLAVCANGFNKTGESKAVNGALYNFQCTTPVITCPKNPSFTMSSLDVEIISMNPEQTAKSIRYTCKYWTPVP